MNIRAIIAVGLLVLILIACFLSTWDLRSQLDLLNAELAELRQTPYDRSDLLLERSRRLNQSWNDAEEHFVLYINHTILDTVTQIVAGLPALAQHDDHAQLFSSVDTIIALLDDVWKNYLPSYRTLL